MNFMSQFCVFISLLALSQSVAISPTQTVEDWRKHHHKSENICKSLFNGTVLPHPNNCHKFYVCVQHEPIEYNCDTNFHFDKSSHSCVAGNDCKLSEEAPATCAEGSIQGVVHDCYIFETCINGNYQKINCPSGYYFYAPHSMCRPIHYNAQFKCNCVLPEHTVMENQENCETFYVCEDKRAHLKQCPSDEYYNSTINACLPDLEGVCLMQPTKAPLDQLSKTEVKKFINNKGKTLCEPLSKNEVHFQAHEEDCNKFHICANGQLYDHHCPQGFYYEADQKYCVVDTENKCKNGKLTTTEYVLPSQPATKAVDDSSEVNFKVPVFSSEIVQQKGPIFKEEEIMLPPNLYHQTLTSVQNRKKLLSKFIKF